MKQVPAYVLAFIGLLLAGSHLAAETKPVSFNGAVRPLLSDHCYACHGPDQDSREAGLRLDRRQSAVIKRSDAAAIVPGQPDSSELVSRIKSDDPDIIMPPPTTGKSLTADEQQVLIDWIRQGANYERHWSFVPPQPPLLPTAPSSNKEWSSNPIDHFIQARLAGAGLQPNPAAHRETLIRRVTLDLTGLPPTPTDVDKFLQDTRDDAYERLVDRLLSSTAYAERRAQDWLDLARYADTRGYADDKMRAIWPWRDWVIRAIDRNMPFDQFTIEQLAGDMLPNATTEQRLATAFHRNAPQARGMTYPVEEYRIKGVVDRVNTLGRVWLGLTLGCAECHNHKFDPVTQADYYSLFSIFNNIEHRGNGFAQGGPTMDYRPPIARHITSKADRQRLLEQLAAAEQKLPQPGSIPTQHVLGTWDRPTIVSDPSRYSITTNLTITARIRTKQPVGDIVSKYDWRGKQRSYVFGIGGEGDKDSRPGHLFFWVSSRAATFNGVTVYSSRPVNDGREHHVAIEFVAGKSVRLFIDGIEDKAARLKGQIPSSIAQSNRRLAIGSGYNNSGDATAFKFVGEVRAVQLSDQAFGNAISIGSAGDKVLALLDAIRRIDREDSQRTIASVPVMQELAHPRKTFVHLRGNFLTPGNQVFPAVPGLFETPKKRQPTNRIELARWLVNGKNPLVGRVVVNRFWQSHFGYGLVRTPDDFGAQGSPPTHPQLLDWLAIEFVRSGWDMKHMHRLIVMSATYQQSSQVEPQLLQRDPENLLLARMPRVRLPAEQIRDQALAIAGLLVHKVGGPPVYPTQPPGYWQRRVLPGEWKNSSGPDRYRKTIYTYWRRMALHPTLELLNAPARENCVVRRDVSNVPTQALVLLNDPTFHEAAQAFASRLLREVNGDDLKRLEYAFRLALSRLPTNAEQKRFLAFLSAQRKDLSSDTKALKMLSNSVSIDVAAWTLACSVILNLDETITRP